jgi:hypothetical protein
MGKLAIIDFDSDVRHTQFIYDGAKKISVFWWGFSRANYQ